MKYRYITPGASLALDATACVGCLRCVDVCPHAVFASTVQGTVEIASRERCMECGACALNCPRSAIRVDSGVGCAAAVIGSLLRGKGASGASCECGGDSGICC